MFERGRRALVRILVSFSAASAPLRAILLSRRRSQGDAKSGIRRVGASLYAPEGTRQGRKQLEKGIAKETRKNTRAASPSAWLSSNAHNWLCILARSHFVCFS